MQALQVEYVDAPIPEFKRESILRDQMFAILKGLEKGKAVEINRGLRATRSYIYRFRRESGMAELQFMARTPRPGWSRIWRIR